MVVLFANRKFMVFLEKRMEKQKASKTKLFALLVSTRMPNKIVELPVWQ